MVLGFAPSSLSARSQLGSILQDCLDAVFTDASLRTFPQDIDYLSKINAYNLDYPVYPAAIVRPKTVEEVSAAVQCAVKAGVKVQPRSGGHSFANYCLGGVDGALVVDLVHFQKFEMDRTTWRATIGAGTLLADVTKRLHDAGGRAIAHGTCPQVGHATIGGLGPTSRQWGSTLDHIREVEVVLADGTITRANENQNPDLYFAIRGAAASFGIVTEFVFETHPEPASTVHYSYTFTFGDHTDFAKTFAKWQSVISTPNLDRKLASTITLTPVGMIIAGTYFGTRAEYDALNIEAHLAAGSLIKVDVIDNWVGAVLNWAQEEAIQIVGGIPAAFYSKSLTFTPETLIPAAGIDALFKYIEEADKGTVVWFVIFDLEGGATNDVPLNASAYAHRDTLFYIQTYAIGLGKISQTTHDFLDGINDTIIKAMPGVDFGAYPGYVDKYLTNGQHEYWGSNYPKLQQIKTELDPQDVFWNPQSVRSP
ncbi:putative glucooligosaccharide oxidase [Phlegmacium glaucopus]|nr:putative glucooligosaccharide oxidase [Phlegmacium glaucopus]